MRHALFRRAALCAVFALVVASCGDVATEPSSPESGMIPVIVDGDLGPDDLMALLFLLQRPDVDLLAITVSGTGLAHCPEGADNAAALLEHVGRAGIPVGCGTDTPLQGGNSFPEEWRLGADGLGTQLGLPVHEARTHEEATQLLVDTIRSSTEPVRLLSLGPLTNVAGALIAEPDLAESIGEVVIMGGAVDVSGTVAPAYEAEWNFWVDPHAANVVLESGIPIRLVPLDATNDVPATRFFFEMLETEHATPEADLVYQYFNLNPYNLDGGAYFLWDPLAAVTLVEPGVVTYESAI